ncbi:Response regulator [Candidatus Terasakiella magnetica]|nr:Response regulator [Candidatus Terasakiella magnetica]
MADKYRADPIYSIGHVNEYVRDHDSQHHGYPPGHFPYPASEAPKVEHSVADVASILGLPESLVTPAVLKAMTAVLSETDRLHWIEAQYRRRLAYLEGLSDHHSVVPALNRRGFMRELEALLTVGDGTGTVAVLHAVGVEQIYQVFGLTAGDGALRHVCAHLVGALRSTDPVGLVGGSDFAVLLPDTGLEATREKILQVMERINAQPFVWEGERKPFALFSGYHVLEPGENGEMALAVADRARRGLSG